MVFIDPRGGVNWTNQFSPFKRLRLEEGMMVVSPGYLIHFIEPTDYHKPVYQERVLIVSNIHRMYEDWIEVLKNKIPSKVINAAPPLVPNKTGSASGFRKAPCDIAPAIPKVAPTKIAAKSRGALIS